MTLALSLFGDGLLLVVVGILLGFGGAIGFSLAILLSEAVGTRLGR